MKTELELIPAPIAGLNYADPPDEILPIEMTDCRNVYVQDGFVHKRHGYKTFGGNLPLSGAIMGFDVYRQLDGTKTLLALTTRDIYKWNASALEWDLLTVHASIDNCDDDAAVWVASANVTAAFEGTIKKEGTGSVKLTIADGFTTPGLAAYHDKAIGNITAYNHLRAWIYSTVALNAGDFQIVIDDTAGCVSPLRSLDLPAVAASTWTLAFLDLRSAGSVADLTSIASIGLKAITDVGACTIYLDQFDIYDCFTGDDENYFSYDHIRGVSEDDLWWCCSNNLNVIKKYDGDTGIFENLGGTPPLAGIIRQFKDYLFALNTTEGGDPMSQRARWPDTANPENWTTGNSSYSDLPGSDGIMAALRFKGNYICILKDKSLWIGYPSDDEYIFGFSEKVTEIGCAAGKTAVNFGEVIIFLGWDDIYKFDGIEVQSIGKTVRKELFRYIKTAELGRCFALNLIEYKQYWLQVVSTDSDYPDIAWIASTETGRFTRYSFADCFTAYGLYYLESALLISDLTMKIRDMTWKIDDRRILSQFPTLLLGDPDGYVYESISTINNDNGTAVDGYFDTKDFHLAGADARMRVVRLDTYYTGGSLDIYYSTDKGGTWTLLDTLDTSIELNVPRIKRFRITGKNIRWRFRNDNDGETFSFQRAVMYWQKAGERLNG